MTQAERDRWNADRVRFYSQRVQHSPQVITEYNRRTAKLVPTGAASRDKVIAARINLRSERGER